MDLSADQFVLDGLEAFTLVASGVAHIAIAGGYQLPDRLAESDPSEGGSLRRETEWHIPTETAAGVALAYDPKPGDTITGEDGIEWTVLGVRQPKFGDYWGLTCRRSSITEYADLVDAVTLYPSVDTTTAAGSKVSAHTVAHGDFANVPAKIQLRASVPEEYHGKKQFVEVYDIYVAAQLPQLHNGDLIKDGDGVNYTVVSWRNREQIDELSVIVCEFRPVKAA
jgi:hypothetical protein